MKDHYKISAQRPRTDLAIGYTPPMSRRIPPGSTRPQLSALDIWRMLVKRKFLIVGLTIVCGVAMAVYASMKTPVYEGVARLQIDPSHSQALKSEDSDKNGPDIDSRVRTEVEIIRSNTVAMQVIDTLHLYSNPVFAGAEAVHSGITEMSLLPPGVQRHLLDRFGSALVVRVIPSTQIIEVQFRSSDPALASNVANSVVTEYIQRNFQTRVDGANQVAQWLSKQMEDIRQSTVRAQQKFAEFQKNNNLLGTEDDNIVTNRLKQLNQEVTQAEADRIVKEGRFRLAGSGDPELVSSIIPDAILQNLQNRQADLETQHALLASKYGTGYPKLHDVQTQLAAIMAAIDSQRANIRTRLSNEYQSASKTENQIRKDFEKQKTEVFRLDANANQYAILKHEVESGQQLYDALQLKVKEASVTSGLTSSYVNVIDHAALPDGAVEPRKKLYVALGLGGGLFAGIVLGLILDSFDDTFESPEQLEVISALPELGTIPFDTTTLEPQYQQLGTEATLKLNSRFDPVSIRKPNCMEAEAYRSLCSLILRSPDRASPKVMVVTSATAGEGKSTVSCNVAAALAQRGRKVLLVDADMRCSSIHGRLDAKRGLGSMGYAPPTDYVRYQPVAELPNLNVVPAGFPPVGTSTEILASPQMEELVATWRDEFDHVIIDTPPILPFADALFLSAMSDGVLLVARSQVSRGKAVLRARDMLAKSGVEILGFVLNAVKGSEFFYAYPAGYRPDSGVSPPSETTSEKATEPL